MARKIDDDEVAQPSLAGNVLPEQWPRRAQSRTCRPGTYDHDHDASTRCKLCPAGTYSGAVGITICGGGVCGRGTFAPAGAVRCAPCRRGTEDSDFNSATRCDRCPAGYSSTVSGSQCKNVCGTSAAAACTDVAADNFDACAGTDSGGCSYTRRLLVAQVLGLTAPSKQHCYISNNEYHESGCANVADVVATHGRVSVPRAQVTLLQGQPPAGWTPRGNTTARNLTRLLFGINVDSDTTLAVRYVNISGHHRSVHART